MYRRAGKRCGCGGAMAVGGGLRRGVGGRNGRRALGGRLGGRVVRGAGGRAGSRRRREQWTSAARPPEQRALWRGEQAGERRAAAGGASRRPPGSVGHPMVEGKARCRWTTPRREFVACHELVGDELTTDTTSSPRAMHPPHATHLGFPTGLGFFAAKGNRGFRNNG